MSLVFKVSFRIFHHVYTCLDMLDQLFSESGGKAGYCGPLLLKKITGGDRSTLKCLRALHKIANN